MRTRLKPPAESKAKLMLDVQALLQSKYPTTPDEAVLFLLNYFTAYDLVGIRQELQDVAKI